MSKPEPIPFWEQRKGDGPVMRAEASRARLRLEMHHRALLKQLHVLRSDFAAEQYDDNREYIRGRIDEVNDKIKRVARELQIRERAKVRGEPYEPQDMIGDWTEGRNGNGGRRR